MVVGKFIKFWTLSKKQKEFERLVKAFTYHQEIGLDSLMPHVPSLDSGITFGPGFDVKGRTLKQLDQVFLVTKPKPGIKILKYWQYEIVKDASTKDTYAARKQFVTDFKILWRGKTHEQRFAKIYEEYLKDKPFPLRAIGNHKKHWKEEFLDTYKVPRTNIQRKPEKCYLLTEDQQEKIFTDVLLSIYQKGTLSSMAQLIGNPRFKPLHDALVSDSGLSTNKELAEHLWDLLSAETCAMLFDLQYNPSLIRFPTFFDAVVGIPVGKPIKKAANWWVASAEHVRHQTLKDGKKVPLEKRTAEFFKFYLKARIDTSHPFEKFYGMLLPFLNKRDRIARRIYPIKKDGAGAIMRISTFGRLLIQQTSLDYELPDRDSTGKRQNIRFKPLPSGEYELTRDGGGLITVITEIKGTGMQFTKNRKVEVTCQEMRLSNQGLQMLNAEVSLISLEPRLRLVGQVISPGKTMNCLLDRSVTHDLTSGLVFGKGVLNAGPIPPVEMI